MNMASKNSVYKSLFVKDEFIAFGQITLSLPCSVQGIPPLVLAEDEYLEEVQILGELFSVPKSLYNSCTILVLPHSMFDTKTFKLNLARSATKAFHSGGM